MEKDLSDVCGDRVLKTVPPIARFPIKRETFWPRDGKSRIIKNNFIIFLLIYSYKK
jgi:hypothetical protein